MSYLIERGQNDAIRSRIEHGQHQFGAKFDASTLLEAPQLHEAYATGDRVEVDMYGDGSVTLRGTISTTTGWRPAFLLVLTSRSHGSIYLPDRRTRVLRTVRRKRT